MNTFINAFTKFLRAMNIRPVPGDILLTITPINGAAGMLTPSFKNGFIHPYAEKTGVVIHLKSMDENVLKACLSQGRVKIIGTYEGDENGVAQIDWIDELKEYSMKIKKPVSLLDKDFWPVLEKLKAAHR